MKPEFGTGNGRTSRALLLTAESGYDVFKYISISRFASCCTVKYAAIGQYTESDGI